MGAFLLGIHLYSSYENYRHDFVLQSAIKTLLRRIFRYTCPKNAPKTHNNMGLENAPFRIRSHSDYLNWIWCLHKLYQIHNIGMEFTNVLWGRKCIQQMCWASLKSNRTFPESLVDADLQWFNFSPCCLGDRRHRSSQWIGWRKGRRARG